MADTLAGTPKISRVIRWGPTGDPGTARPAVNDNCASIVELDQYYTAQHVADHLYGVFQKHFHPDQHLMVEPSAGLGAFFKLLPAGNLGYDLDPRYPGIKTADFLAIELPSNRRSIVIGNPPFGRTPGWPFGFSITRPTKRASSP